MLQNIFSKEPCQATFGKTQRSATDNSTIKHPKWPVPLKAHILCMHIMSYKTETWLLTLDSFTVMGRFRRYCPESAISISCWVAILKLLFFMTCIKNQIIFRYHKKHKNRYLNCCSAIVLLSISPWICNSKSYSPFTSRLINMDTSK